MVNFGKRSVVWERRAVEGTSRIRPLLNEKKPLGQLTERPVTIASRCARTVKGEQLKLVSWRTDSMGDSRAACWWSCAIADYFPIGNREENNKNP